MTDHDISKTTKGTAPQKLKPLDSQFSSPQNQFNEQPPMMEGKGVFSPNSKNLTNYPLRVLSGTQNDRMKQLEARTGADQTKEDLSKENEKCNSIITQLRSENQRLHKMLDEEREMHHQVIQERNTYISQLTAELDMLKSVYKQDHQWMLTQEAELHQKEKEIEKKQESLVEKENQLAFKEQGLKEKMRRRMLTSSEFQSEFSPSHISEFTDPRYDDLPQGFGGTMSPRSFKQDQNRDIQPLPHTSTANPQIQQNDDRITLSIQENTSQRRIDSDFVEEEDSECSSQKPSKRRIIVNSNTSQKQPEQHSHHLDNSNLVSLESLQSDRENKINFEDNIISDPDNSKLERDGFELLD